MKENYTYYLLLATGVIVLLTIIGLMALPILFVALPIIGLITAIIIWTADITVTGTYGSEQGLNSNVNKKD